MEKLKAIFNPFAKTLQWVLNFDNVVQEARKEVMLEIQNMNVQQLTKGGYFL